MSVNNYIRIGYPKNMTILTFDDRVPAEVERVRRRVIEISTGSTIIGMWKRVTGLSYPSLGKRPLQESSGACCPSGVTLGMLLDFTGRVPFFSAEECPRSVVARTRAVNATHGFFVWHKEGAPQQGQTFNTLTQYSPDREYPEGNDQTIRDFLLRPHLRSKPKPHEVHSFRVVFAVPATDHPWTIREHWVRISLGNPSQGAWPKLWLDESLILDIPTYDPQDVTLPSPPFKIPKPPEVETIWDRISKDD